VEERLEEFFTEELASVVVHRAVVLGDPAPEIVRRAHAEVFDLIVMPTHGYGPFRRLLLGSVTAKVLHDADCPVLTGPHMEQVAMDHAVKFQKIVCALDLGPHSPAVLEWAAKFSQSLSAELAIVHALTIGEARVGSFYFDPDWRTQLINSARSRITYLCENAPVLPQVCVETGDAPHVVAGVARRIGADLVIIGRSSAPGIAGRLRENAYAIVRGSPCAVLSV
jgi:nucleotide-binding universal stress UspA family protein